MLVSSIHSLGDAQLRWLARRMANERGRRLLRFLQDMALRQQIAHAAANSPFYRQKFAECGVNPQDIGRASDLPALGFFTYPSDLAADPYQFLAVPKQEIVYAMASSGTTGRPKIVFLSKGDWEFAVRMGSIGMTMAGITAADVVQILFCSGNPNWMTGDLIQAELERIGTFVLPAGNSVPIAQQIEMMQMFGTTVLMGTPSYVYRLTEEGSKLCDLRSLGIRLIKLAAEPWSESLRTFLQEAWGAKVYDSYGMMELACDGAGECPALCGLHLSPYLLVEVVDPRRGVPLPRGELGELVFTTLYRRATPLLRYRTGDLARLLPDEMCPCGGVTTERISRIVGRADDMLFLGSGENVFPAQIEAALMGVEGLSGFQVIIDKAGYRDRLRIRAETTTPSEQLQQAIERRLSEGLPFLQHEIHRSQLIAPLEIEFVESGTLQRETPVKVRRLVDRRGRGDEMEVESP